MTAVSLEKIARTTHGMQNLLMLLKAHIEKLQTKLKNSSEQRLIGKETQAIYVNVDRLSKLMGSLSLYKKVKGNTDLLKKQRVDLGKLITHLVDEYEKAFPKFVFSKNILPKVFILGDAEKLQIVLRNILENAMKYSKRFRRKSQVSITLKKVSKNYQLDIMDNGIGIPAQDIPKIFLPFYRGRRGIDEKGSGLGLAICREIIQFHHGKITVQSKVNQGTKVTVILPVKS